MNGKAGWFYGNSNQFFIQLGMAGAAAVYSLGVTMILYLIVEKTVGFRAQTKDEDMGLDITQHGEEGYNY